MLNEPYSQKRLDEAKAAFAALPADDAAHFLLDVLENGFGMNDAVYDVLVNSDVEGFVKGLADLLSDKPLPASYVRHVLGGAIGGAA